MQLLGVKLRSAEAKQGPAECGSSSVSREPIDTPEQDKDTKVKP